MPVKALIPQEHAATIQLMQAAGTPDPWVTVGADLVTRVATVTGVYKNRDAARAEKKGSPYKYSALEAAPAATPKVGGRATPLSTMLKPVAYIRNLVAINATMERRQLLALALAAGIAENTAKTQLQWALKAAGRTTPRGTKVTTA